MNKRHQTEGEWRQMEEEEGQSRIRVGGFGGHTHIPECLGPSWHLVLFNEADPYSICDELQGKSETDQYVDTVRVIHRNP